jgi:hypothetical protein
MSKNVESDCSCDCSGKGGSTGRAMLAGAFGGIIGVAVVAGLATFVLRRFGPRLMGGCDCCPETKECTGRGDCGGSCDCGESCDCGGSCDCGPKGDAAQDQPD